MTEIFINQLLIDIFYRDKTIPEWGNWIAIDSDGEVCVFEQYPVIVSTRYNLSGDAYIWDSKQIRGKDTNWETLFFDDKAIYHAQTLICTVEDLLAAT